MSSENESKINRLLRIFPSGVVLASSWLSEQGYSPELVRNYRKNNWLESFGHGAMIRYKDKVDYLGAIYCLQQQLKLSIHPAARTAMALLGRSHYLELNQRVIYLFGSENEVLPTWFKNKQWDVQINYITSSFLPQEMGLVETTHANFTVRVSTPVRAIMECLYLAPKAIDLLECYELMQGLNNLPPKQVQELLQNCTSVKVKRLFLYLAEKANHAWFNHLKLNEINLGTGKRSLVKQGIYIPKYQITVPKELEQDESPEL